MYRYAAKKGKKRRCLRKVMEKQRFFLAILPEKMV